MLWTLLLFIVLETLDQSLSSVVESLQFFDLVVGIFAHGRELIDCIELVLHHHRVLLDLSIETMQACDQLATVFTYPYIASNGLGVQAVGVSS